MISIKLKASVVKSRVDSILKYFEDLQEQTSFQLNDVIQRLTLIQEMMQEIDPDSLVTIDEEAYEFLMR